jgi:hypothetical protein
MIAAAVKSRIEKRKRISSPRTKQKKGEKKEEGVNVPQRAKYKFSTPPICSLAVALLFNALI